MTIPAHLLVNMPSKDHIMITVRYVRVGFALQDTLRIGTSYPADRVDTLRRYKCHDAVAVVLWFNPGTTTWKSCMTTTRTN